MDEPVISPPQESRTGFVPTRTVWSAVILAFFFGVYGNTSPYTWGIIAPGMIKDHLLTPVQIGLISTIVLWLNIPASFYGSWLADVWGPRLVGAIATGVAAVCNIVFPFSSGFGVFLANRLVHTAGGIGGNPGIGNRLLGGTISSGRRGVAASFLNISFPLGQLLLVTVGTVIVVSLGWRSLMYVFGVLGVLLTVIWVVLTRRAHFKAGGHSSGDHAVSEEVVGLREVFRSRTLLGVGLGWGFSAWSFIFLVGWLPLYLMQARHMSFQQAGFSSVAPWIGGILGGIPAGFVSDAILRRTKSYRLARVSLAVGGQFIFFVCLVAVAYAPSINDILVLLFIAELVNQVSACMFQVIPIDTVPASAGSATSYVHAVTAIVGAFSPLVAGVLFQAHEYGTAFIIAGIFPLVGGLIFWWLVYPGDLRPWGRA